MKISGISGRQLQQKPAIAFMWYDNCVGVVENKNLFEEINAKMLKLKAAQVWLVCYIKS